MHNQGRLLFDLFFFSVLSSFLARGVTETHGRHIDTRFIILRRRAGVWLWFIEGRKPASQWTLRGLGLGGSLGGACVDRCHGGSDCQEGAGW